MNERRHDATLWRCICVQKIVVFHPEDRLVSRIFHSRANEWIWRIYISMCSDYISKNNIGVLQQHVGESILMTVTVRFCTKQAMCHRTREPGTTRLPSCQTKAQKFLGNVRFTICKVSLCNTDCFLEFSFCSLQLQKSVPASKYSRQFLTWHPIIWYFPLALYKCLSVNPCHHQGVCDVVEWIFQCDCSDTDHHGSMCVTGTKYKWHFWSP